MPNARPLAAGYLAMLLLLTTARMPKAAISGYQEHGDIVDTSISSFTDRFLEYYDLPGFIMTVVKDQKPIFRKACGFQNKDAKSPITQKTVFSTASVTKLFTSTAVMQLYDAGLVDINSPVISYLPYFKLKDPRYQIITVKQMLSHTSGMPDIAAEELYYSWTHPSYADDALENYVRSLDSVELIADPGTEYSYSNMAFDVLADLVAKVSGQSFEDYIAEHILDPLDMSSSSVDLRRIDIDRLASPHLLGPNLEFAVSDTMPYSRNHAGCGTLFSSVEDLNRFAAAILRTCYTDDSGILSDSSLRAMWTPVIQWSEKGAQGLGWIIWKQGDRTLYELSGGDPGYRCEFILIPEDTLAVIAMTNSWEHDITPVTMRVIRALLGEDYDECPDITRGSLWKSLRLYGADSALAMFAKIKETRGMDCLHPAHFNQLADILIDLGRYEDACKLKEYNAREYSRIPVLKLLLAEAYLKADDKSAALKVCEDIIQKDPDNERALEIIRELEE